VNKEKTSKKKRDVSPGSGKNNRGGKGGATLLRDMHHSRNERGKGKRSRKKGGEFRSFLRRAVILQEGRIDITAFSGEGGRAKQKRKSSCPGRENLWGKKKGSLIYSHIKKGKESPRKGKKRIQVSILETAAGKVAVMRILERAKKQSVREKTSSADYLDVNQEKEGAGGMMGHRKGRKETTGRQKREKKRNASGRMENICTREKEGMCTFTIHLRNNAGMD